MRTWPTTSVGSSSSSRSTILAALTSYFAAIDSSVSVALTVTTRPVTGGILSTWPILRSSLDLSSFAHHTVIIETSNLLAIATSVSPDLTL